jgi:hypothetical protein
MAPHIPDIGNIAVRYYHEGHDKTLRFGQFFLNQYLPDVTWDELYYEADNAKALLMILKYLNPSAPLEE